MIDLNKCVAGDFLTFTDGSVHEFESFEAPFLRTKTPRAPRINLTIDVSDPCWVCSESGEHITTTTDGNHVVSVQTVETKALYERRYEANKLLLKKIEEQLNSDKGVRFGQLLACLGFDHDRFYEEPWKSLERIEKVDTSRRSINRSVS